MNEMVHYGNRAQCNSRWSDVSRSLPRENANVQTVLTDNMGWTQQDANLTCLKKIGVIKTTEDEMTRKSKTAISKQKVSNFSLLSNLNWYVSTYTVQQIESDDMSPVHWDQ
jgi:hypothetical protein